MRLQVTAVFEKVPLSYIAYVEELPGANTQGRDLEEARSNLFEAVEMTIEANRYLYEEEINAEAPDCTIATAGINRVVKFYYGDPRHRGGALS